MTYLGVADEHDLGVRALLVVARNGLDHGSGALRSRVLVANSAAVALPSTSRVHDGFCGAAGVGLKNHVHKALRSAVTLRDGRLTSPVDVDFGA